MKLKLHTVTSSGVGGQVARTRIGTVGTRHHNRERDGFTVPSVCTTYIHAHVGCMYMLHACC